MKFKSLQTLIASVLLCAPAAPPALALDAPKGDVILTIVSSHLEYPNAGRIAECDLAMLEKLSSRVGTMAPPWTRGEVQFSGPLLRVVLEAAGANGAALEIKALNDYVAEIPMEDATSIDTMLLLPGWMAG